MDPRHQIHQSVIALRAPLRSRLQEACRFNRGGIRKASDLRADGLDSGDSNANLKDEEEDERESRRCHDPVVTPPPRTRSGSSVTERNFPRNSEQERSDISASQTRLPSSYYKSPPWETSSALRPPPPSLYLSLSLCLSLARSAPVTQTRERRSEFRRERPANLNAIISDVYSKRGVRVI